MRYLKFIMLSFLLLAIGVPNTIANDKTLIISPYGSDYQESNAIIDRIAKKAKETNPSIKLNIENLSTNYFPETNVWTEQMTALLNNYKSAIS